MLDQSNRPRPDRVQLKEVVCPAESIEIRNSLFIGGGISDCPDWQREMIELLSDLPITAFNPRRPDFPMGDPAASLQQIDWEHRHLKLAEAILFWFPKETLCPITLYELGKWTVSNKKLFIGVHPDYQRKIDVEIQTRLERPEVTVVNSLHDLAAQVQEWRLSKP
ncbi:MAG: nucleoside 2-deoxyribosyltransferase domain-containing protein [Bdellovibrionales bacterium]|nr:nucleoside 2-deoxyribosyltransferase domain-containing protein [Bdellovibrionales bacterium]